MRCRPPISNADLPTPRLKVAGAVEVQLVDLDEARELGEVDDDPPPGDFNDAASLAIVTLAEKVGLEDPGSQPVPVVLARVGLVLDKSARRLERAERFRHMLDTVEGMLDAGDVDGALEMLRDRHLAKAMESIAHAAPAGASTARSAGARARPSEHVWRDRLMTPAPLPAPAKGQRWRDRKVGSVVTIRDVLTMRVVVVDERAKERSIRKWTLAQRYSPVPPLSVGMWVRLVPGRGLRRDRELGLLRPDWTGKVVNLTEKDGRLFAVCFHEPEDCGCHLAPRAAHRGLGSLPGCPRCHGTGIALNRSLPVEDIEEVPHAHQVPEYS